MKVLIVASEVNPFVKVGGLADVAGALPKALANLGCEVSIVMPMYRQINLAEYEVYEFIKTLDVPLGYGNETASIKRVSLSKDIHLYLIDNGAYFQREALYNFPDDPRRFIFFSKASFELAKILEPDIIHCNDWHTALVPGYVKYYWDKKQVGTLFSIHNLAYQGLCERDMFIYSGLPEVAFNPEGVEFYGKFNIMKSGIVYSDMINTVSPTYAEEIKTPEFGCGLDGLLRSRSDVLVGILNGIDEDEFNPQIDRYLPVRFSVDSLEKKEENKRFLLSELGLIYDRNIPVVSFIGRLWEQKGIDIILQAIPELMSRNIYLIILGTGSEYYHQVLSQFKEQYPDKVSVNLKFDNRLAHLIYGGSDFLLMPSRFEPCGLGQMIAMKYGTIPIVRGVGGLKDTVRENDTGFVFFDYTYNALIESVDRAINLYNDRDRLEKMRKRIMLEDYSWGNSAKKYLDVYDRILKKR
ncbi:glycogen synthase GlgA [bacterium]|nr:glycogen synthase GlgA [bacterium]